MRVRKKFVKGFSPLEKLRHAKKKSLTGFTLMEIIVVVAIISILTGYTAISFSLISPRKIEAETRKLVSDLCWVRDMAVARHNNFVIDFDTANRSYYIYQNSISPANLIERKVLNVDAVFTPPAPTNIHFYSPKGATESKQITLSYGGKSRQITVFSETGYIKWQ